MIELTLEEVGMIQFMEKVEMTISLQTTEAVTLMEGMGMIRLQEMTVIV